MKLAHWCIQAFTNISRHLLHLREEFIPIPLFREITPDSIKREIVETLLIGVVHVFLTNKLDSDSSFG